MSDIQTALKALKTRGHSWRGIGRELGVTDVYVAMLADGRRKIRKENPLYRRIVRLTNPQRIWTQP